MFFGLHTTKKTERDAVRETPFTEISVDPNVLHRHPQYRPIIWHEGGGWDVQDTTEFDTLLEQLDRGIVPDPANNPYTNRYHGEAEVRVTRLPGLYADIKKNGVLVPIAVEVTGERLDGAFRTKIASHLGIPAVPARLYRFKWNDVGEDFIERKLESRNKSVGVDYYRFSFGYKDWENVRSGGSVHKENATDRWAVWNGLVKENSVLDLGCNEGYLSMQLALQGKTVRGIDIDFIHIAWLNKLIFEWVNKRHTKSSFEWGDIKDVSVTEDAVLLLNVLYHLPRQEQVKLLDKLRGKTLYFQCNLRKHHVREQYYTSHPDDLKKLLDTMGFSVQRELSWRDKPIIIAK